MYARFQSAHRLLSSGRGGGVRGAKRVGDTSKHNRSSKEGVRLVRARCRTNTKRTRSTPRGAGG